MGSNNIPKQLLILIIASIFCWNISTAMYVNPPQHEHSKGAPTTVCVEIKPNGVETHNPYYMCNRPQFQTRQLNMPTEGGQTNKENYSNYMPQQPINTPSLVNAAYQQQQQLPWNSQNYPYYRPQQTQHPYTGDAHQGYQQNPQNLYAQQYPPLPVTPITRTNDHNYPYHAFQKSSGINLNSAYHQNHNVLPLIPTNNGGVQPSKERNQQQTYAHHSQPSLATVNLVKDNEKHYSNFQTHQQQTAVTKTTNYENHQQQPLNTAGVVKAIEENKQNYTQQQTIQAQNGQNLQPAYQTDSSLQANEPLKNFFNHNKEPIQHGVPNPRNTEEAMPEKSIRTTPALKEALLSHANTKQQQDMKQNVKPPLNREEYQALIKDEVLRVPNLTFSSEEMLPIQQLFRGNARIPLDHINDPILRTFYNINQTPEVYSQALGHEQNCNDCRKYSNSQPRMEPYLTQLHKLGYNNNVMKYPPNPYMDPNCIDCRPYTMQPILLAIPLFGTQIEGASFPSAQNARALPCGYSNSHVMPVKKAEQKTIENEQPRLNTNSSVISKTTLPTTTTTTTPSSLSTTLASEEDLFKEDSIENIEETKKENNNNKKQTTVADNNDGKKAVNNVRSTTSQPLTTAPVTTFKTIMHAAKMMAKLPLFHHNKRQADYEDGELSTYFKKQYLTELKKSNSEEDK